MMPERGALKPIGRALAGPQRKLHDQQGEYETGLKRSMGLALALQAAETSLLGRRAGPWEKHDGLIPWC